MFQQNALVLQSSLNRFMTSLITEIPSMRGKYIPFPSQAYQKYLRLPLLQYKHKPIGATTTTTTTTTPTQPHSTRFILQREFITQRSCPIQSRFRTKSLLKKGEGIDKKMANLVVRSAQKSYGNYNIHHSKLSKSIIQQNQPVLLTTSKRYLYYSAGRRRRRFRFVGPWVLILFAWFYFYGPIMFYTTFYRWLHRIAKFFAEMLP